MQWRTLEYRYRLQAMYGSLTGNSNIAIGVLALSNLTSGTSNVCVGYNIGPGLTTGSYNLILGCNGTSFPSGMSSSIVLGDGNGNIRMDYNYTTSSNWTFTGTLNLSAAASAATLAAAFVADHRLAVTFNGVTYYLPCSTTAW